MKKFMTLMLAFAMTISALGALAEVDGNIVAVKYKEQYGLSFHPELDEDDRIHEAFLESVKRYAGK